MSEKEIMLKKLKEIENGLPPTRFLSDYEKGSIEGKRDLIEDLEYFINNPDRNPDKIIWTEDKELEKEIERYFKDWSFDEELDIMVKPNNYSASFDDIKEIARYFAGWGKEQMIKNSIPAYQETNKCGNKQLHSWSGLCELDELEEGEEVKIAIIK